MFTGRAAVTIRQALVTGFAKEDPEAPPSEFEDKLRDELEAENMPPRLIVALADSGIERGSDCISKLRRGRYLRQDPRLAKEVAEDFGLESPAEAGEEALRRLANVARKRLRTVPDQQAQLDEELRESGYKWDKVKGYVAQPVTNAPAVPTVPKLAALIEKAELHNAEEILELLAQAEAHFYEGSDDGHQAAAEKASEVMANVMVGVARKFESSVSAIHAASVREVLHSHRVLTRSATERVALLYKALCETPHDATGKEDAALDLALSLVTAEYVLRRYVAMESRRRS
jgi:hypothetical protein